MVMFYPVRTTCSTEHVLKIVGLRITKLLTQRAEKVPPSRFRFITGSSALSYGWEERRCVRNINQRHLVVLKQTLSPEQGAYAHLPDEDPTSAKTRQK